MQFLNFVSIHAHLAEERVYAPFRISQAFLVKLKKNLLVLSHPSRLPLLR